MIALLKTSERTNNFTYANNYVYQRHVFAYQFIRNKVAGKQVLELGCGEGYGMQILSAHTNSYHAVDKKKPDAVSFYDNRSFQLCNLPSLSGIEDNRFDTIICYQVIEHIKNDGRLLQEIKRVLKPGGTLYLTTPNKLMSLTRNPFHIREYLPLEMKQLVAGYFNTCTVQGIYGNDVVMKYYHENKKNVERITRFDLFNFQYRLPAFLLRGIYSVLNNVNRFMIARKAPDITAGISYEDFYVDVASDGCLDYFVTAIK